MKHFGKSLLRQKRSLKNELNQTEPKSEKGNNILRYLFPFSIWILLTFQAFPAVSQIQDFFKIPVKTIKTVVLETSGLAILKNAKSEEIKVSSSLKSEGKIYGFQFPSERPDFQISKKISGDTLYIQTPKRYSPSTIGFSTYKEEISNILEIPFQVEVIVTTSENLQVLDYPIKLHVKKALTVEGSELQKKEISKLECIAKVGLTINGQKKIQAYEVNQTGRLTISIHAEEIKLNLK